MFYHNRNDMQRDMHRNFVNQMQDAMIDKQIENRYCYPNSFKSIVKGSKKNIFIKLIVGIVFVAGFEMFFPGTYPFTLALCGLILIYQFLEHFL